MRTFTNALIWLSPCMLLLSHSLWSEEMNTMPSKPRPFSGWSTAIQGNSLQQFSRDLDDGGDYSSAIYNIQVSRNYLWDRQTSASIDLNYRHYDYHFSSSTANNLAAASPWNKIHSLSLSAPLRKGINARWSGLFIPSVSFNGESNADFNEAITAGAFAAATYRFNDNLSIGSGVGVTSQLDDSAAIFPMVIVRWNITDRLSLASGTEATVQGPGISLSYKANKKWKYTLGGYYQKLRFRLAEQAQIAGGIGEDKSIPLVASATYNINPVSQIRLITGLVLEGELTAENNDGDQVVNDSADTGLMMGVAFNMRL